MVKKKGGTTKKRRANGSAKRKRRKLGNARGAWIGKRDPKLRAMTKALLSPLPELPKLPEAP